MTPSFRAAVIQEWRGLPETQGSRDRWQPTSQLLPALMQKLGLKERLRESEVIDAWSSIVGEFIAAHSAPVALRDGILCPRPPAFIALRTRADREDRNLAKTKTTLRWQNHSRRSVSCWMTVLGNHPCLPSGP